VKCNEVKCNEVKCEVYKTQNDDISEVIFVNYFPNVFELNKKSKIIEREKPKILFLFF
jgi:hypothetical protein